MDKSIRKVHRNSYIHSLIYLCRAVLSIGILPWPNIFLFWSSTSVHGRVLCRPTTTSGQFHRVRLYVWFQQKDCTFRAEFVRRNSLHRPRQCSIFLHLRGFVAGRIDDGGATEDLPGALHCPYGPSDSSWLCTTMGRECRRSSPYIWLAAGPARAYPETRERPRIISGEGAFRLHLPAEGLRCRRGALHSHDGRWCDCSGRLVSSNTRWARISRESVPSKRIVKL